MTNLRAKAVQLLKDNQYKEAIAILKDLISYAERRVREGHEIGVDSWPYRSLASIYRKQGEYELEYKILERCLNNPRVNGATHEAFAKEASMRIERHRLLGPDGKGQCHSCKERLILEKNESGEWLCGKCRIRMKPWWKFW